MPDFKQFASVALIATLNFPATPARANPALVAAPAICATGVGCILVGTVVVAGVVYYVWQNGQTGEEYRIVDPESEAESMGSPQTEPVTAGTRAAALRQCQALARGRTLQEVRWFQGNQWECIFY